MIPDLPPLECNYGWPIVVTLTALRLLEFTMLSIAAAFVSLTVTKSKFFTSFRDFFFNMSGGPIPTPFQRVMGWVYELVTCPYCFSHWVCIALVAIYQPRFTDGYLLVDLAIATFAMVGLTSYLWVGFSYLSNKAEE